MLQVLGVVSFVVLLAYGWKANGSVMLGSRGKRNRRVR